jgi:hypothetical protein
MANIGEVWRTKSGNLVLIVDAPGIDGDCIGMLWFDNVDNNITFSFLYDRLDEKVNMPASEWLTQMSAYVRAADHPGQTQLTA